MAEICWRVWSTPANFNGFRVLAALLYGSLVVGVSQTAALNRGRHLYSAGRPSRWALAHILVLSFIVYILFSHVVKSRSSATFNISLLSSPAQGWLQQFVLQYWIISSFIIVFITWVTYLPTYLRHFSFFGIHTRSGVMRASFAVSDTYPSWSESTISLNVHPAIWCWILFMFKLYIYLNSQKAIIGGRRDHFSTKNSTNNQLSAVAYLQFQIQVCSLDRRVSPRKKRASIAEKERFSLWPWTLTFDLDLRPSRWCNKDEQACQIYWSFRSKVIVHTHKGIQS